MVLVTFWIVGGFWDFGLVGFVVCWLVVWLVGWMDIFLCTFIFYMFFFLRGYFWIGQFFGYTKDEYICEL